MRSRPALGYLPVKSEEYTASNRQVLDTFERYFKPTVQVFDGREDLPQVSVSICGHVNTDWVRRVADDMGLDKSRQTIVSFKHLTPCGPDVNDLLVALASHKERPLHHRSPLHGCARICALWRRPLNIYAP